MKVIYLTDIHDDLKELRFVIRNTNADLYIISGDLIYKAFYTYDKLFDYIGFQEELYKVGKNLNLNLLPYDLATLVVNHPYDFENSLRLNCEKYLDLFEQAVINMREKYSTIRELIRKYAAAEVIFIPGNYDMNLDYTMLRDLNLHRRTREIKEIKFSGYGGAPVITLGIPEKLAVEFKEGENNGQAYCEAFDYFSQNKPDVLVIHNPAFGTFDRLPGYGSVGSKGIREYIDLYSPALALSGHVHEHYGLMRVGGCLCLNPSNFGRVESVTEADTGGYFCEFDLFYEYENDKRKLQLDNFTLKRIYGHNIINILNIVLDDHKKLVEQVLDQNEFEILGSFLQ